MLKRVAGGWPGRSRLTFLTIAYAMAAIGAMTALTFVLAWLVRSLDLSG